MPAVDTRIYLDLTVSAAGHHQRQRGVYIHRQDGRVVVVHIRMPRNLQCFGPHLVARAARHDTVGSACVLEARVRARAVAPKQYFQASSHNGLAMFRADVQFGACCVFGGCFKRNRIEVCVEKVADSSLFS